MATFNKRPRDDKGAGKIKLGEDVQLPAETTAKGANKTVIFGGIGALAVAGLAAAFFMSSDVEEPTPTTQHTTVTPPQATKPNVIVPQTPPVVVVPPAPTQPIITVQSATERVNEKIAAIYDHDSCLYEAFVSANGREVREGSDFNHFTCLYDFGGVGVLITEGEFAGTRVGFFPREGREGLVFVEHVAEQSIGDDGRTTEFHRLQHTDRERTETSMARPVRTGDGVYIAENADRFTKTVRVDGSNVNAFILAGDPASGRFEIEIPNGDYYQIDLTTGDFTADSLFMNCRNYVYGEEAYCPRDNFQPIKGVMPTVMTPR